MICVPQILNLTLKALGPFHHQLLIRPMTVTLCSILLLLLLQNSFNNSPTVSLRCSRCLRTCIMLSIASIKQSISSVETHCFQVPSSTSAVLSSQEYAADAPAPDPAFQATVNANYGILTKYRHKKTLHRY